MRPGPSSILPVETTSLLLRAFVPNDAAKVFAMSREDGMRTFMPSQVYPDEGHAASVLAFLISQYSNPADPRRSPYVLGIEMKSTGTLIGHVGLNPLGVDVEIGYAVEESHQRRGFATEAVSALCAWSTRAFSLERIVGVTAVGNVASQRVLLRAGFTRQAEEVRRFQGLEQPVIVFTRAGRR